VPWLLVGRVVAEAAAAFGAAAAMVGLCWNVTVNPLDRVGQVSGLAAAQYRMALLGLPVVVVATVTVLRVRAMARDSPIRSTLLGVACAAVAGLATGATAGGLEIVLHGTDWGLNAQAGDVGNLIGWAKDAMAGRTLPSTYPPLAAHLIAAVAQVGDLPAEYAMKWFQIWTVAAVGPLAYLAWRLLLTPLWALVIGVTAALPLIDAYKPYANLVLVVLVPVLIRALMAVHRAGEHGYWHAVVVGLFVGVALGILFEGYFGWFLWSLPAVAVSVLIFLPWGTLAAMARALTLMGVSVAVFFAITHRVLIGVLTQGSTEKDTYFYFDTEVRPTFFVRWFDDRPPPNLGVWPPPGGLGNVDLFSVLLFVGLGVALVLGYRRVDVPLIAMLVGGAWLLRFSIAQRMFSTHTVQLYPRTSVQILYGFLLLTGLAVMLAVRRSAWLGNGSGLPLRFRAGTAAGTLAGSLFLYGSIADATANDYMARNDASNGQLAYRAQTTRLLDGNCPEFTHLVGDLCVPNPSITTDQNGVIGVTPTPTAAAAPPVTGPPVTGPIAAATAAGPAPSAPSASP
jgi:galactan 5-O-arabinofuranosyltransferase